MMMMWLHLLIIGNYIKKNNSSLLSLSKQIEHVDCVLPVENQALQEILNKVSKAGEYGSLKKGSMSSLTDSGLDLAKMSLISNRKSNFDNMNNIVANLLLNTTW